MDPYQTLGVARGCAPAELKEAFRNKALEVHPDRGGDAAEFVRLREAYNQIVAEMTRKQPARVAARSPEQGYRTDSARGQPDPNWEPDLIVLDEPLPRIRPVRPPEPGWEPDLVVRDEPLPRIRPARPRKSNWEPELVVSDNEIAKLPKSSTHKRDRKVVDQNYSGWLRGVGTQTQADGSGSSDALYAIVSVVAFVAFVVLALCWMFWPSNSDRIPTKPSDLASPSRLGDPSARSGQITFPDWTEMPGVKQAPVPEQSQPASGLQQLMPLEPSESTSGSGDLIPRL
jgi:DnaJ domain